MTVRLILDTSAVVAYVRGSIHVGELLAELQDEHEEANFAVPVVCLAEAGMSLEDEDTLFLLARHGRARITPVPAARWPELVNLSKMLGHIGCAATFLDALGQGAYVLTAVPGRYPDTDIVIEIP